MLTLGSVKVAAAHDQTPKRNQRQKKVESDLSGSHAVQFLTSKASIYIYDEWYIAVQTGDHACIFSHIVQCGKT